MVRLLRSTTLTVLLPSPTHASRWWTVSTPSGPEVSLLPVNPTKPVTWNCTVLLSVDMTSSDLLERSARRYCSRTGSTQLISNDVRGTPGIWIVVIRLKVSSALAGMAAHIANGAIAAAIHKPRREAWLLLLMLLPPYPVGCPHMAKP